jgi:hypothetical protein
MTWLWFAFAFAIANAAAVIFYLALRIRRYARMCAWLACSGVIAISPLWVPIEARALRFLQCVVAVCLVLKLYDAHCDTASASDMGMGRWAAHLPNWFWFMLRRVPRAHNRGKDWRRVAALAPLMVAAVALCWGLLRTDWARVPFALEHVVKTLAFAIAMICIGQTFAALCRQLLGPALDPFGNPMGARTPAEFWRRWNRPFREFFDQYVFRSLCRGRGGRGARHPVRATLAVFAVSGLMHEYVFGVATGRVQGWQMLFFMVQGCAAAATLRLRPRGRAAVLSWATTLAFNLATAALFCRSVNEVIAFYQRR